MEFAVGVIGLYVGIRYLLPWSLLLLIGLWNFICWGLRG